ncbi:MAG TPA: SUMF1/EgtB/PvdO family nonheme iron enzyme, partial [Vicinamibacterales bacterium]|nr:SUMF1/EgtB/PvdO family nonheme iron enzyme [Vicinamibacterales bacterium]
MAATATSSIDRAKAADRFRTIRERSRRLFDLLEPDAYYSRPIALRNPIVFYEGHLPAFSINTLIKRALGQPGIDARLELLFARGIDPEQVSASSGREQWPSREEVRAYVDEADRRVLHALRWAPIEQPGHPLLDRGEAVYTILEHEEMHQETLLYMWHRLPYEQKRAPANEALNVAGSPPLAETIHVPAGRATVGANRADIAFGWDNEFEAVRVDVAAFDIDRYNVTNASFLEFVDAGGYRDPSWWTRDAFEWLRAEGIEHPQFWSRHDGQWWWRGMFQEFPLPASWP